MVYVFVNLYFSTELKSKIFESFSDKYNISNKQSSLVTFSWIPSLVSFSFNS